MRKGLIAAAVVGSLASMSSALAVDSSRQLPSAMLTFQSEFGGAPEIKALQAPRFGFKVDYDRRFADAPPSPLMQVQFSPKGFESAAFNGLPFAMRIRQVDQFERQMDYTVFDYGLAALGLLAVGYAVYEVADSPDETPDPVADNGGGGGGGGGGVLDPVTDPLAPVTDPLEPVTDPLAPVTDPLCEEGLVCAGIRSGLRSAAEHEMRIDPAYLRWLDGGTGQMGDLGS